MPELPHDVVLVRTTPEFDESSVPHGLLRAHRVAAGVWGRLLVRSGTLRFGFDDDVGDDTVDREVVLTVGDEQVIPPGRPHHVTMLGPVRFVVEFHEPPVR